MNEMFISSNHNSTKFIVGLDREELAEIVYALIELQGENDTNADLTRYLRTVIIDETDVTVGDRR